VKISEFGQKRVALRTTESENAPETTKITELSKSRESVQKELGLRTTESENAIESGKRFDPLKKSEFVKNWLALNKSEFKKTFDSGKFRELTKMPLRTNTSELENAEESKNGFD
jgi:hypothetical protein